MSVKQDENTLLNRTVRPKRFLGPIVLLFLGVTTVGFFSSHATLSVDPPARYLEAKAIVDRGELRIDPIAGEDLPPGIFPGKNGQLYSYFGIGQSLIFAGPYCLCQTVLGIQSDKLIRSIISLTVFPLTLGLTAVVFFGLLREFGFGRRNAYLAAALLIFATGLWQVSKEGQEDSHLALIFVLAAYGLRRYQNNGSLEALAASAAAIGFAFVTRGDTADTVLCYLGLAFYLIWKRQRQPSLATEKSKVLPYVLVVLLTGTALAVYMVINRVKFGNGVSGLQLPFKAGVLVMGLKGLLLSPGRSVFLYNPILVAALAGMVYFWKRERAWAVFVGAAFIACLLLHASLPVFHGNCCWGPRYWCRQLPLVFLAVAFFGFDPRGIAAWRRVTVIALAIVSVGVQVAAVSLHHNRELAELAYAYNVSWSERQWTMFEPEANFLPLRLVNLHQSVTDMSQGKIAPWPNQADGQLTREQRLQTPTLHYLAYWPFHLTYYLPTIKSGWAVPLWGAWTIFVVGMTAGLSLLVWGGRVAGKAVPG